MTFMPEQPTKKDMIQLTLFRSEGASSFTTCVWVKYDKLGKKLKSGSVISLKGEKKKWRVLTISTPMKRISIKRHWPKDKG